MDASLKGCRVPYQGKVVRVSGTADFIEDQALKEEIVNTRPFLKPHIEAMGFDIIKVLRVTNPIATVWTMEKNMDPREFIKL
jgi:pyridoxamine 5'-phosphate oxidase